MVGLKKLIGFILSWFLYYIGHLTSKIMFKRPGTFLWYIYQYTMMWSVNIQDWAKNKTPWKDEIQ
jgi:hypothetical protein